MPRIFLVFGLLFASALLQAVAAPTITALNPPSGSTVPAFTTLTVTFNEQVAGVDANDLLINNEGANEVVDVGPSQVPAVPAGRMFRFTFTQPAPGAVSVSWDFDHGIAGLGTGAFAPGAAENYTLTDTIAPTMAVTVPANGATVTSLSLLSVTFSEPVTGVDAADLLVNGVPSTDLTGSGSGPYYFNNITPAAGPVSITWAAGHGITDLAAVPNAFSSAGWSATVSATPLEAVVINEFVAANASGLLDENTSAEDWIEIHNPGATTVSLAGWSLTDDPALLNKWVFPNWTLGPGRYLVIFASGKDRRPAQSVAGQDNPGTVAQPRLHTNFTLSPSGGYLALTTPNAPTTISSTITYPEQRFNYSYGPQTNGALRYFASPTPGLVNAASALTAICAVPNASVPRGYFKEPFSLVLSTPESGGTIRYTLNGSEPTASNGTSYTGPLTVNGTTILRMATFSTAKVPSTTVTHSYIYLDQVLTQPSPPYFTPATPANPQPPSVGGVSLPIAWGTQTGVGFPGLITNLTVDQIPADYGMDPEIINDPAKYDDNGVINNLTGKTNLERINQGFRDWPLLSVVLRTDDMFGPSGLYPNSRQKGTAFEKLCSVELLMPDGTTGFATTCGLRIHGNASREPAKNPKHGFKLNFKGSFGASSLEAKLFPDSPVEEFDDIILRADFNSSWLHWDGATQRPKGTRLRDAFCKDTFRAMGRQAGHHRYVHLFINGIYWGTYDPTEQENNGFAAAYFGGSKDDYDVVEQGLLKSGTATAYNAMNAIAAPIDNPKYEQMKGYLDVLEFADYMLLHFYLGHQDWGDDINKNWYAVRNFKKNGKFNYLPWDMENLMWDQNVDRTGVTAPASGLHPKLVGNAQYRLDFADRVHKHMVAPDGALLPSANIARWNKWRGVISNAIACESARWGDYRRDVHAYQTAPYPLYKWNVDWIAENNRLTNSYFPVRTNNVLAQLRTRGLYPTLNAGEVRNFVTNAVLGNNAVEAGTQIKFTLLTPAPAGTTSAGTIYYTTDGSDPRVTYSGAIGATATAYTLNTPITVNTTTTFKVRALNGTTWSALNECTLHIGGPDTGVRITELHYNPSNAHGGSASEFVELFNTSNRAVDLTGWFFDGIDFIFPAGTVIGAGDRLVIANNNAPSTFAAQYPGVSVLGYFGGNLANDGERVALMDATGRIVVSVTYDDGAFWPGPPDGAGPSLEIIDPLGDPDWFGNWKSSAAAKGTPGAPNSASPGSVIRISEVCAQNVAAVSNNGSFQDYVELENTSVSPVDVGSYTLVTSSIYTIPPGTSIPGGGFLVLWIGPNDGSPGLHTGSAPLSALSGQILLNAPFTNTPADSVRYGNQVTDYSLARVGGAWTLANPSAGAANTAATVAPLSGNVAFNEWLADSPGESDWLEIYNKHASLPVNLTGAFVQTNTQSFRIVTPNFLGPRQFVRLTCSEDDAGPLNLDFNLSASGTTLTLLDSSGLTAESVAFAQQTSGVSQGRLPDGTATIASFVGTASPGATNYLAPNTGPNLNEVLVTNTTELAPWGTRPAWIELLNPSAAPLDLSGMRLNRRGSVWNFPAGTTIATGETLAIWSDPSQPASTTPGANMNAGIGLLATGDSLIIQNAAGQNVSQISWGPQIPDRSIGVIGGTWQLLQTPTRGSANSNLAPLGTVNGLRINEWSTKNTDWFELYNGDSLPVAIGNLYISDDASEAERGKFQIPPLSFIAGQSWQIFDATNTPSFGATHVNFTIDDFGEYLRLSKNDGAFSMIDAVSFGPQPGITTSGRLSDGTPTISAGLTPTPNAANLIHFANWAAANGIPGATPTGDADNDGISNLQEFLHRLSPAQSTQGAARIDALPKSGVETIGGVTYITVVHRRAAGASLSSLDYQLSNDLITWTTTEPSTTEVLAVDPANGDQTLKLRFAVAEEQEKAFVRLLLAE